MNNKQKIIAAKHLNRIKIQFSDDLMTVNSYWCRYAMLENGGFNRSMHHHTFYELHYSVGGYADFWIENQPVRLTKNHFFLLPPLVDHRIDSQSDDFVKLVFGFEIVLNQSNNEYLFYQKALNNVLTAFPYNDTDLMRLIPDVLLKYCYERYENMYSGITGIVRILIHDVASQILPESNRQMTDSSIQKLQSGDYLSDKITHYIADNVAYRLTAKAVAEQFHISFQQLNRILIAETGMTISQLISNEKIKVISGFLENSDLSLSEIAVETGFSNEYNLNRFFKKNSGMTPGKYRKSIVKHTKQY